MRHQAKYSCQTIPFFSYSIIVKTTFPQTKLFSGDSDIEFMTFAL